MNGSVRFIGHPNTLRSIQWSADAEIALAFADHVEILIPRYPLSASGDKDGEISRWHVARLTTNTFATNHVPLIQPQPTRNFSLGVEQSLSHITSLAWSGPGLAEHGRCALAVLTSNHVLSIWASSGSTNDNGTWGRVLIVNHCFMKASSLHFEAEPGGISHEYKALHAKALAWSSSKAFLTDKDGTRREISKVDMYHLAVMNGTGDVAVVRVDSPYMNPVCGERKWIATMIYLINCDGNAGHTINSFMDGNPRSPFTYGGLSPVREIHWSPWVLTQTSHITRSYCILAVLQGDSVHFQVMFRSGHRSDNGHHIDGESFRFAGEQKGGLGWALRGGHLCFIAAQQSSITCFEVRGEESEDARLRIEEESLLPLENPWTKLSGIARNPFSGVVYMASHSNAHALNGHIISSVPVNGQGLETPEWQKRIHRTICAYDFEHSTKGRVTLKVWGLATSPCDDYVACLFTMHPSSLIQYEQYAKSWSTLEIAYQGCTISDVDENNIESSRPNLHSMFEHAVSLEGLHFSAVRNLRAALRDGTHVHHILDSLRDHLKGSILVRFGPTTPPQNRTDWVPRFQALLYDSETFVSSVLCELQGASGVVIQSDRSHRHDVAIKIAIAILEVLPEHRFSSRRDLSILNAFQYVARGQSIGHLAENRNTPGTPGGLIDAPEEECVICEGRIIFSGTDSATCALGHTFARCSMSFLPIQIPGVTKSCRMCKAPYLRFGSLTAQTTNYELDLAVLLEQAVYMCVFCGGKFES